MLYCWSNQAVEENAAAEMNVTHVIKWDISFLTVHYKYQAAI